MSKTEEKTRLLQPEGASDVPNHPPAYSSTGQYIVVQQPAGFQGQQQPAAAAVGGYAQPTFYQGQQQPAPAGYTQPSFYQGQHQHQLDMYDLDHTCKSNRRWDTDIQLHLSQLC